MDFAKLEVFRSEDLKACTNNFNIKSIVGVIQFGKLYRGKIKGVKTGTEGQDVMVKIWDKKSENMAFLPYDECLMVKEEVEILTNPTMNSHPNLAKLIGYCLEEEIKGVVYDLSPLDSLQNLMLKDDLNWLQRINVVLEIARLLKFLHGGDWDTSSEVFSFGVILLGLIAKRTCELEKPDIVLDRLLHVWAKKEYKPQCSLVHNSLQEDWGYHAQDGIAITELGMCCIEFFPRNRPTMKDVVERLESLHILQRLGDSRAHKRGKKFHDNAMCL
ncbi:probable serine/threonine-protein kinase PBL11 isoform X2 [Quercus robur]|uniref:probable serine/threonine-protein kinase PBL11 isoform X2 n=1 Tax=Quercus robur TaxID=38942 RepID=UPI0021623999|nr:probable serine/threonine-protein kinase PBL11 isoform X2 [Quercus robur]